MNAPDSLELALLNLLNCTAMELFDLVQTCLQTNQVSADDWELARSTLSHALAALEQPAVKPA